MRPSVSGYCLKKWLGMYEPFFNMIPKYVLHAANNSIYQ